MKQSDLAFFRQWFSDYTRSFHGGSREDLSNIRVKEVHTYNVCENMRLLIKDPEVRASQCFKAVQNLDMIAEAVALFHDVGRFHQYAEYKTFRDAVSINHALLGAEILSGKGVLENLSGREAELMIKAVKFHNALKIPDIDDDCAILLLKMVRDADKLDIWRVFLEYYISPTGDRLSAAGLGLPDTPDYSPEVIASIFERRVASLSAMKTVNDFKLLQLSWVYDLNFNTSLKVLLEKDYINQLIRSMPQTGEILRVPVVLWEYMEKRLSDSF